MVAKTDLRMDQRIPILWRNHYSIDRIAEDVSHVKIAFQRAVGAQVRELWTARGISQEAFADACGLHRTHMSLLERGKINITLNTLRLIARNLDIKLSEFFKG